MKRVAFIGRGRIATGVARAVDAGDVPGWEVAGALARDDKQGRFPGAVFTEPSLFYDTRPDVIVEAGGPAALAAYGPDALAAADVWTISASALADQAFFDRMSRIGSETGHRLRILAGAFGGMDVISALAAIPGTMVRLSAQWTGDDGSAEVVRETAEARAIVSRHRGINSLAAAAIAGTGLDETVIDYVGNGPAGARALTVEAAGKGGQFTGRSVPTLDPVEGAVVVTGSIIAALRNETRVVWCG